MKMLGALSRALVLSLVLVCLLAVGTWGQSSPAAAPAPAAAAASIQAGSASTPAAGAQTEGGKETSIPAGKNANPAADGAPAQAFNAANAADKKNVKGASDDAPDGVTKLKIPTNVNEGATEDWNTLKISSNVKVADPLPPLVAEFPGFTREFTQLEWRPGDVIDLYVMKPAGVKKPPVILYLYSFPSDTDRFKDDTFAKLATKDGFAAVGFVSALTGQRFHHRPTKEWFVSELQESLATSVHDVQLLLNYLDQRGDLDMTRVGMFGDGSGGSIAIMASSVDPRIKALELFDPWGDWPDWLAQSKLILLEDERATYVEPEFLKKVENLDPVKYLPQLTTQRVDVQFVDTDTVTPKAARVRMEAATPPNARVVHYASPKEFMKTLGQNGTVVDWLKAQLVPAVATQRNRVDYPAQSAAADKNSER